MDWEDCFHQYKDKDDMMSRDSARVIVQDMHHLIINCEALFRFASDGFSLPMTQDQFMRFVKVHRIQFLKDHTSQLSNQLLRKVLSTTDVDRDTRRAFKLAFDIEMDIEASRPIPKATPNDIPYV